MQFGHPLPAAPLLLEAGAEGAVDAVRDVQKCCRNQQKAGDQPRLVHPGILLRQLRQPDDGDTRLHGNPRQLRPGRSRRRLVMVLHTIWSSLVLQTIWSSLVLQTIW